MFPASGCPLYSGLSECLTDAQIQTEINNVIASKGWVKNGTNMFFMFTPQNVGSCFDSGGVTCAYTAYCAYHGTANSGAIYANQPFAAVSGCDEGQYPNGSNHADPTINVVSHEHNEAITDPQLNAWYDAQGNEIGDKCAWKFGTVSGPGGAEYNQTINNHHYFLQMEWSNSGSNCLQSFAGGGGGGNPPQIFSFTPARGRHGTFVTITGKNFTGTTAVTLVRGLTNYSASYSVLSNTQIKATVPNAGTGYGKWKVTNPGGSATSTSQFYVTG